MAVRGTSAYFCGHEQESFCGNEYERDQKFGELVREFSRSVREVENAVALCGKKRSANLHIYFTEMERGLKKLCEEVGPEKEGPLTPLVEIVKRVADFAGISSSLASLESAIQWNRESWEIHEERLPPDLREKVDAVSRKVWKDNQFSLPGFQGFGIKPQ